MPAVMAGAGDGLRGLFFLLLKSASRRPDFYLRGTMKFVVRLPAPLLDCFLQHYPCKRLLLLLTPLISPFFSPLFFFLSDPSPARGINERHFFVTTFDFILKSPGSTLRTCFLFEVYDPGFHLASHRQPPFSLLLSSPSPPRPPP